MTDGSSPSASAVAAPATPPKPPARLPETGEGMPWVSPQEIKKESNPFTERDWRMWLYAWAGMAVRFIVVFGSLFTVFQYLATREEKRVEQTLKLVELWEDDKYQESYTAVAKRLDDLNSAHASELGANPSAEKIAFYQEQIGNIAMTETGGSQPLDAFRADFARIVYVLNRVGSCVETNICAPAVADAYFRDFAASFWAYFSGYIRQERRRRPNFARPIETYVMRTATTPAPAPAAVQN